MTAIFVVLPIFLVIAIGYYFKRKNLFSRQTMKELNRFLFWVAMPALLVRSIFSADVSELENFGLPLMMNIPPFLMVLVGWVAGKIAREEPKQLSVTVMSAVRSNQVFVGFPIAWLAFGQEGLQGAAIFLAFTLASFQFFSIGGAQLALEGEFSAKAFWNTLKALLKNPLFITTITAVPLALMGLNKIPTWLDSALKIVADVGTGMALVMVGTEIVLENILERLKRVRLIVFLRLIVNPIIAYLLLSACGVPPVLTKVATLLSGTPVAVNSLIVAKGMGMDVEYMADSVIVTTVLSVFSLTALLYFMGV